MLNKIGDVINPENQNRIGLAFVSMVLGLLVCDAFGTVWLMTVYARSTGAIGLGTALGWCVFPFVIPDIVKIILALLVCKRLACIVKIN